MRFLVAIAISVLACSAPESTEADAGTTADAGTSADAGAPGSITFRLRFVSDIPESIYLQTSGLAGHPEWITTLDAGANALKMFRPCEVCECGACDQCGVCGAAMPMVEAIESGADKTLEWTAVTFPWGSCSQGRSCYRSSLLEPGGYTARFCWGSAADGTGPGHSIVGITCADVPFTFPVEGGVVSYTVDHGG